MRQRDQTKFGCVTKRCS